MPGSFYPSALNRLDHQSSLFHLTVTGVSVLNPASASQLPLRCRLGLMEYHAVMQIKAL